MRGRRECKNLNVNGFVGWRREEKKCVILCYRIDKRGLHNSPKQEFILHSTGRKFYMI